MRSTALGVLVLLAVLGTFVGGAPATAEEGRSDGVATGTIPFEAGKATLKEVSVDMRGLVLGLEEMFLLRAREKGLTLVPLKIYFQGGWAKVQIALARGKKTHDKRDDIAKRDAERDMARVKE